MSLIKLCPWAESCPVLGLIYSTKAYIGKTLTQSCLKPLGIEPWYCVFSII